MKLEKRRALVTGAGAGIGKALAERFAREGAAVVVSDVRRDTGEAVVAAIAKGGGKAHFVAADMTREADVERLIQESVSRLGGLDLMVNNAGMETIKPVVQLTEADWDRVMNLNVKGVFFGCKHAIPAIEK